jgi:hypothetical protein
MYTAECQYERSILDSINLERFHCQNQFLSSSETFWVMKPVIHIFRQLIFIINGTLEIPLTPIYTLFTNKMPHTQTSHCVNSVMVHAPTSGQTQFSHTL